MERDVGARTICCAILALPMIENLLLKGVALAVGIALMSVIHMKFVPLVRR